MSQASSPNRVVCPSCLQPVPIGQGPARKRVRCPQCLAVFAVGGSGRAASAATSPVGVLTYVASFCAFLALTAYYWVGVRQDPKCFVFITLMGLFGLAGFITETPPAWIQNILTILWWLMAFIHWMVGLCLRCLGAGGADPEGPPQGSLLVIHVQLLAIYLLANLLGWACRPLL